MSGPAAAIDRTFVHGMKAVLDGIISWKPSADSATVLERIGLPLGYMALTLATIRIANAPKTRAAISIPLVSRIPIDENP